MISKEKISALASEHLKDSDRFIMEVKVKTGNIITVYLDGDTPVTIDDCVALSRHIESGLDRDEEDFELRVTSYGADKPLILPRQYRKNTGRDLNILTRDGKSITGKLLDVEDDSILIEVKKEKKKNQFQATSVEVKFEDIEKAMIVIAFR